jgi:Tfp pilus assembly protein PilN
MLMPPLRSKIDGRITLADPYAHVARTAGVEADFPLCIAEGLALRTLQPEAASRIDFLAPYYAQARPHREMRRELTICAGLAAAIAAVWVIGLFLQLSSLESDYARLKRQAHQLFRQAVPDEQNVVDPAAQLQQKLDALRKDAELFTCFNPGQLTPLEIWQALSQRPPARGELKLDDLLIAGGSVRITGRCDSFATLSEWQRLLETIPGLQVVDVPSPKKDAESGKVQFTISLSSVRGQAS